MTHLALLAVVAVLAALANPASEPLPPIQLLWLGASAYPSLAVDRRADVFTQLDAGVELHLWRALTMGAHATPVFLCRQASGRGIFGMGFGVDTKLYFAGRQHMGPYIALGSGPLWTHQEFDGNASRLNLASRITLGWKLEAQALRAGLFLQHISNAWTATPNHGLNGLGLLVGLDL